MLARNVMLTPTGEFPFPQIVLFILTCPANSISGSVVAGDYIVPKAVNAFYDEFLLVTVAKDLDDYSAFIDGVRRKLPCVTSIRSNISLRIELQLNCR